MKPLVAKLNTWWTARPERVRAILVAFGLSSMVTVIITWPTVSHLTTNIPGYEQGDQLQKLWALWYTKQALLSGHSPVSFPLLAYPDGYTSPIRWAMLVIPLAAMPFSVLFSPVTTYNLMFLLSYVLTGVGGYLLCYDISRNRTAALIGGLAIMASPARVTHALGGFLEASSLILVLVYMLMLRRLLLKPDRRQAIWTGLILGLASMTHITTLPYNLLPWSVIYIVAAASDGRGVNLTRPLIRELLVMAGVGALLTLPFFLPFLRLALGSPQQVSDIGAVHYSSDLLSYVSPPPTNSILAGLGLIPAYAERSLVVPQQTVAYIGVSVLIAAVWAVWKKAPESRIWLLIALISTVLAFGPYLKAGGSWIGLPGQPEKLVALPYRLLEKLPIFKVGRTPSRFNLIAGIAWGVLVAQGLADWLRQPTRIRQWATWGFAAVLIVETLVMWPVNLRNASRPSTTAFLAAQSPDGAVLDVPFGHHFVGSRAIYNQMLHSWPLIGGFIGRRIPLEPGLGEFLSGIADPMTDDIVPPPSHPDVIEPVLAAEGIRYVVLHRYYVLDPDASERWLAQVLGPPIVVDEATMLYRVEAGPIPDGVLMSLYGGWGEAISTGDGPARPLINDGQLIVYSHSPLTGTLAFHIESPGEPMGLTVSVNGEQIEHLRIDGRATFEIEDLHLNEGYTLVDFTLDDTCPVEEICVGPMFRDISLVYPPPD